QWMRIHGNQALATMLNSFGDAGEHEIGLSAFGDGSIGAGISRERLVKRARKEKEERAQCGYDDKGGGTESVQFRSLLTRSHFEARCCPRCFSRSLLAEFAMLFTQ